MLAHSKGIAIDLIAYIAVGIVGIGVLLYFIQGPLSTLTRRTFCFFYENLLKQKSDYCTTPPVATEDIYICESMKPNCDQAAKTQDDMARLIAAYAIVCWQNMNIKVTNTVLCYNLYLETHPGPITEEDMTKIMEKEKGCNILENSKVVNTDGNLVDYSGNCGTHDNIILDVSNNLIYNQQLILIWYDTNLNKIIIKGG